MTLLIGGAPASGKTTLAHQFVASERVEALSLDELVASETEHMLRQEQTWDSPDEVVTLLRHASHEFAPALETLVYRAQNLGRRVVIESERIRPDSAAALIREIGPSLGVVFLVEPEADEIRRSLYTRSRSFRLLAPERQESVVRVDSLYGRWLDTEARALRLPVLSPRPWSTLVARVSQALARLELAVQMAQDARQARSLESAR